MDAILLQQSLSKMMRARENYVSMRRSKLLGSKGLTKAKNKLQILEYLHQLFFDFEIRILIIIALLYTPSLGKSCCRNANARVLHDALLRALAPPHRRPCQPNERYDTVVNKGAHPYASTRTGGACSWQDRHDVGTKPHRLHVLGN